MKFLTLFTLITSAFWVEGTIRACHLNDVNTTDCYRQNLDGMLKILKRLREKPDPMFMDDISFQDTYDEDGVAKVEMNGVQLHNVLNAGVRSISTSYDEINRIFAINTTIGIPNVDIIASIEIQIECDEDKFCQNFREFYSTGEIKVNFVEVFIHMIMKFEIGNDENRKFLIPINSKTSLEIPYNGLPTVNYKSSRNNQFENVMVKRMFAENWSKILENMKNNQSFLKSYDERFVNATQERFAKLTVYE